MSLRDLAAKIRSERLANANPANPANDDGVDGPQLAALAGLALADAPAGTPGKSKISRISSVSISSPAEINTPFALMSGFAARLAANKPMPAPIAGQFVLWCEKVGAMSPSCNDGMQLHRAALAFLNTTHAATAARLGWDDIELFGMHPGAPRVRLDAQGLIAAIAWGTAGTLAEVLQDKAVFTSGKSLLSWRRRAADKCYAVPIWEAWPQV